MTLRIALAPVLVITVLTDALIATIPLFILACATDFLDGWLLRRLNSAGSSPFWPYLDPMADSILVVAMFAAFVVKGLYPFWTPILIASLFLQFVLTSGLRRPLYDPVGKYLGAFLFGVVGLTLVMPQLAEGGSLLVAMLGFVSICVASRIVLLMCHPQAVGKAGCRRIASSTPYRT